MLLTGCGEQPAVPEHLAFLAPDNQTGDASFDWTGSVLHRALAAAVGFSISSDTVADARTTGANRLVYSTITRTGSDLRLHSAVFDPDGHRLLREFTVTGSPLQVVNRMAGHFTREPQPLGVKTDESLRKWVIPTGDIEAYETRCRDLAATEPGFGPALATCLDQLGPLGRVDAIRSILGSIPSATSASFSPEVQYSFGQTYMGLKEYPKAAAHLRQAATIRLDANNLLGYAEALAGNCAAGRKAIEEYGKLPGEEANALDSLGEISFFCDQFKESEKYFLESGPLWKVQRSQIEPVKAAAARLMTGDLAGGAKMASDHFAKIAKSDPQATAALEPVWKAIREAATPEDRRRRIEATLIRRP